MFGSYVGNWFEFVAVRWIVSQETKSEAWMGYIAAAQLCPTLVLGMVGGLVADSVNRRTLLVVTQAFMMAIALAMAACAYFEYTKPQVFLVLSLLQGVAIAFNMPAWQVLTPRLVPKSDLTSAITLNGISFNTARVVGPAVAGAIMKLFQSPNAQALGVGGAVLAADAALSVGGGSATHVVEGGTQGAAALLFFNAATFIVVMLAVSTTPSAPAPAELHGLWRRPGDAWGRAKEAFSWVWHRKGPRALLISTVIFAVFGTPIMQLMPLMVSEVYQLKEGTYGMLLAVMGAGAVVGGFAMKLLPKWYPMHHFIPLCIGISGVLIGAYALSSIWWLGMIFMFIIGVFWMWTWNSMATAMQHLVSDQMRGRVSAVMNTIAMGLMPLGTFLASGVGHAGDDAVKVLKPEWGSPGLSSQLGLATMGAILVVAGLVMLTWRTPEVDGMLPGERGYDRKPGLWRGVTAEFHRSASAIMCPKCGHELSPISTTTPDEPDGGVICPECGEHTSLELFRFKNSDGRATVKRTDNSGHETGGEGLSGHT
jgi:MFS family permease